MTSEGTTIIKKILKNIIKKWNKNYTIRLIDFPINLFNRITLLAQMTYSLDIYCTRLKDLLDLYKQIKIINTRLVQKELLDLILDLFK